MSKSFINSGNLRWITLFLLVILAILLLVANLFAPKSPASPTSGSGNKTTTGTLTKVQRQKVAAAEQQATATVLTKITTNALDPNKQTLTLENINPDKISMGDHVAISDLEAQIRQTIKQMGLQNRSAAIAIAYGGVDNSSDPNQVNKAKSVAAAVYNVLRMLGTNSFVFCHTVYDDPFFVPTQPSNTVIIDIYFFNSLVKGC